MENNTAGLNKPDVYTLLYRLLFCVVAAYVLYIRIKFLAMPLERDEGEYAYAGQLMLQGIPPYLQAYNMKFPGVYAMYALIMAVFGQTTTAIHIGGLLASAGATVFLYLICIKKFNGTVALAAAAVFMIMSASITTHGLSTNAEHFVLFFALAGILVMLNAAEKKSIVMYAAAGLLFGTAVLMKQQAGAFILFAAAYLLFISRSMALKPLVALLGGAVIPFLLMCLYLAAFGAFDKFIFWTFSYAGKYIAAVPVIEGLKILLSQLKIFWQIAPLMMVFVAAGLFAAAFDKNGPSAKAFVFLLFIFSLAAVCAGLYFRRHYFLYVMPAAGILAGLVVNYTGQVSKGAWKKAFPLLTFLLLVIPPLLTEGAIILKYDPKQMSRASYLENPFIETERIAQYIKKHSSPGDKVAVMGSEPQILFYSQLRSATGYIYMYPLMENHSFAAKMQQEMISEIEASMPRFITVINVRYSWNVSSGSEKLIFTWLDKYAAKGYKTVYAIDMVSPSEIKEYEGEAARGLDFKAPFRLSVLEKTSK